MSVVTSGYIEVNNKKLHYLQYGAGGRLLLCFHGYGNTANLFAPLATYLQKKYTVISIDLPYHGKSTWQEQGRMEPQDLQNLVLKLTQQHKVDKVSLAGFSMGGRVCLKVVELMPELVDKVLLIASDGLVFNNFYYFVTRTFTGRKLFERFLTRPEPFMKLMNTAHRWKWVNASRYKFAMNYLQSDEARMFLLKVWPSLCMLIPDDAKVKRNINKHKIPVDVFMGRFDNVIPLQLAHTFKKGVDTVTLHIVEKGHRVADAETIPKMAERLLS